MSQPAARSVDEEESDERRLQETLEKMSITELFELLFDIQVKMREATNPPGKK